MSDFDSLQSELKNGPAAALAHLAATLRSQQKLHELFEALKMQVRQANGLPILYSDTPDDLSEAQRTALENGLIAACREVGTEFLKQGKVREGWMYLRPVGEKKEAAELLKAVEPNDENTEELIEVLLQEAVDAARGYQMILDHYGVCNAITTYDTGLTRHPKSDQQAAARLLVRRLHADLIGNVRIDIKRQEGAEPAGKTLKELVADRDWLLQEGQYHIDTTHLASTVRIARILEDEPSLRLALDLTEYGRKLHSQFQFNGDEPFLEIYPSHALFFQALLGENRNEALAYFKQKAEELDRSQHGTVAVEVYIDLLARCGKIQEAIDALIQMIPPGTQALGIAPSLYELCQRAGDFSKLIESSRDRGDLLSFAAGVVGQSLLSKAGS
jgi:hypothetical protein